VKMHYNMHAHFLKKSGKRCFTLRGPSRPTLSREAAIFTAETLWRKTAAWSMRWQRVILNIYHRQFKVRESAV